jgi:DNA (cytosine-5)-methyltransferase 1
MAAVQAKDGVGLSRTDPTCIELFAGAGGTARGLYEAGWDTVGYVEKDKHAVATLRAAAARGLISPGKVLRQMVGDVDYRRQRGVGMIWSSFPCPGYSSSGGGMGMDDPRDGWVATVRAIDQAEPQWFIGENVDLAARHPGAFDRIQEDLDDRFGWQASWVLEAADFGVPQHRRRRFFVAGPWEVERPAPTVRGANLRQALEHESWDRLEAMYAGYRESELEDLGPERADEILSYGLDDWWCRTCEAAVSEPQVVGPRGPISGCHCMTSPDEADELLDVLSPTLVGGSERSHTSSRSLWASAKLRDTLFVALGRHRGGLTRAEAANIQGFPSGWPFSGSNQAAYRQIANAVPPPLARAVGASVLRGLE